MDPLYNHLIFYLWNLKESRFFYHLHVSAVSRQHDMKEFWDTQFLIFIATVSLVFSTFSPVDSTWEAAKISIFSILDIFNW